MAGIIWALWGRAEGSNSHRLSHRESGRGPTTVNFTNLGDSAFAPATSRRYKADMDQIKPAASRPSKRTPETMRPVSLERGVARHAEGSCLVKFGDTHVLVTASLDEKVPPWLRGAGKGWVTAEYGMLPRATTERTRREASAGKQSGRTLEIQRLIGRSLRAVVDLKDLGERQIMLDCDVIQADGGTRTASITGAWVALRDCIEWMRSRDMITKPVLLDHVAAVSAGIYRGQPVLDLDYAEDSEAETDGNFVMTGSGGFVEIQSTAEGKPFSDAEFETLKTLARNGIQQLVQLQKLAVT
jgi:ribonuclease PH